MTKLIERNIVLKLRRQGKSYSQIRHIVKISKSTLSCWLKDHPLSKSRIRELRDRSAKRIERFRQTMRQKKKKRFQNIYRNQSEYWLPLSKRELYIAGLFLYWGEGRKGEHSEISITNTDPDVVKFMLFWLTKILGINKEYIKVYLHLYSDMDVQDERNFWIKELNIPNEQFRKPYIKQSLRQNIKHITFGHGTCKIQVSNVKLKQEIIAGLKSISNFYAKNMGM